MKKKRYDSMKMFEEISENLRCDLEPFSAAMKTLEENSAVKRLDQDFKRRQKLMYAAFGPIKELRRALDPLDLAMDKEELGQLSTLIRKVEKQFYLPEIAEVAKLLNNNAISAMQRCKEQQSILQNAMESMNTPWLDMTDNLRSLNGFAELQNIGHALCTMPAFDLRLTTELRTNLGDWRKKINWPPEIFVDPLARTTFYEERGLNLDLTMFPANAFDQSIGIAGIKEVSEPIAHSHNFKPEVEDSKESDLKRTNMAHDRFQRFEIPVREFIDEQMKKIFGDDWIKHQIPDKIRREWMDKRQKDIDDGRREYSLINYANLSDYIDIIVRKDNWEKVFKQTFKRQESVRESFQRLHPIRNDTMHARPITQNDELLLYVETRHILKAIGIEN